MENTNSICPNCNNTFTEGAKYCYGCGQKTRSGKVSVREFLGEFADTVFNIDSKLFKTIGSVFIPGKLTNEYFLGKRKSYYLPIRLFLISLVLLLALISWHNKESKTNSSVFLFEKQKNVEKLLLTWMDSLKDSLSREYIENDVAVEALDSFVVKYKKGMPTGTQTHVIVNWADGDMKDINVPAEDIVNLSEEELFEKYKIEGYLNQYLARRGVRLAKDPDGIFRYILGSMTWMMFLLLPMLGFVLRAFYHTEKFYFIQHLVFLFHIHTYAFLIWSMIFLLNVHAPQFVKLVLFYSIFIYFIIALKKVYKDSWIKTIMKTVLFFISYAVILIFFVLIVFGISFLFF